MKWNEELEKKYGSKVRKLEMELIKAENGLGLANHELHTFEFENAVKCLEFAIKSATEIIAGIKEVEK